MSTRMLSPGASLEVGGKPRPLRVLYSFPHALGNPGIGTIAAWQVRGLIERGLELRVYSTSLSSDVPGAAQTVETLVARGVRIPHRALGVERAYRYHDWRVARMLTRLGRDVDLVHCWPLAAVKTMTVARRLGIATVREVPNSHTGFAQARAALEADAIGLKRVPRGYSHGPNSRRVATELREYGLADLLLMPSAHVERTFLDRQFAPKQLVRHQYGFDPSRFPAPASESRSHDRPLTALFVGTIEPRKGLHYALRAWIQSGVAERGRFIVCGRFLPGYRKLLYPLLDHPSVEMRGFVADVGAVMRQADLFVFPSVEEGSALVTYEAQASGCVLLVSDAAGALCRHPDEALIHRPGDIQTLADHMRLLDRDRALLGRLRAATLARRDELTWSRAAERLAAAYATGIQGRTRP